MASTHVRNPEVIALHAPPLAGARLLPSVFCLLAVVFCLLPSARAEIPEPPTLFYGQTLNRSSGQLYVLTNGTLVWRIVPVAGGSPMVLTTQLEPVAGGQLSYRLKVPHEALAPGANAGSSTLNLSGSGVDYQHLQITVDGFPALVLPPAGGTLRLGQNTRASAYRFDLELFNALPDIDGDGLPDWWEDRNGLDKYLAGDALLDRDRDGASNFKEFKDGSDPNTANTAPTLLTARLPAIEGGTVGVRLQVLDSDSAPGDLRYTVSRVPVGGTLSLRNAAAPASPGERASDRVLIAHDTFTQADVDAGRLIFRHRDQLAAALSFQVIVNDENPAHPASTGTVAIAISQPSATDGSGAGLWLDAAAAAHLAETTPAPVGGPVWADRSGHHYDATSTGAAAPVFESDSPGGNRSLRFDGQGWSLNVPNEAEAFPTGDRTVFAVVKATGSGPQQIFSGTRFELGIAGADDAIHPGQLRYGTEGGGAALYSPQAVLGQWVLATAWAHRSRGPIRQSSRADS